MKFCPRCFEVIKARWLVRNSGNPNAKLDIASIKYPCQIPLYEPSNTGEPMVRIWDCRIKKQLLLSLSKYREWAMQYENEINK